MKELTKDQATTLLAFLDAFEQTTTGVWRGIEEHMRENWDINDPESALEEAQKALQE